MNVGHQNRQRRGNAKEINQVMGPGLRPLPTAARKRTLAHPFAAEHPDEWTILELACRLEITPGLSRLQRFQGRAQLLRCLDRKYGGGE